MFLFSNHTYYLFIFILCLNSKSDCANERCPTFGFFFFFNWSFDSIFYILYIWNKFFANDFDSTYENTLFFFFFYKRKKKQIKVNEILRIHVVWNLNVMISKLKFLNFSFYNWYNMFNMFLRMVVGWKLEFYYFFYRYIYISFSHSTTFKYTFYKCLMLSKLNHSIF